MVCHPRRRTEKDRTVKRLAWLKAGDMQLLLETGRPDPPIWGKPTLWEGPIDGSGAEIAEDGIFPLPKSLRGQGSSQEFTLKAPAPGLVISERSSREVLGGSRPSAPLCLEQDLHFLLSSQEGRLIFGWTVPSPKRYNTSLRDSSTG
jgi:hypothetical protein